MSKRHEGNAVSKNMWGYRGVEWNKKKKQFSAVIWPEMKRMRLGYFDTAVEAAKAYDDAARKIYKEDAYLNFPREGEKQVIQSRLQEGICAKGHDLGEHGRLNVRGEPYCKKCNAMASKRAYQKRSSRNGSGVGQAVHREPGVKGDSMERQHRLPCLQKRNVPQRRLSALTPQ